MKVNRVKATSAELLDPNAKAWGATRPEEFPLVPTPLKGNPAIEAVSPFIAQSTDHGKVRAIKAAAVHNGEAIAFKLTWAASGQDKIVDLDQFVDGAGVMFPMAKGANAVTMGSAGKPVNVWYWKGDMNGDAFDVVAEGYGTSERRPGAAIQLQSKAVYSNGSWQLVLVRPLRSGEGVQFQPGSTSGVAFAAWDGANGERAGKKTFSGGFSKLEIEA